MSEQKPKQTKPGKNNHVTRQKTKQPPTTGTVVLKQNGSNLIEWIKVNTAHLEATHGSAASFLRTGRYEERTVKSAEELQEMFPTFTQANINKMQVEQATNMFKLEAKDKEARYAIYAFLTQVVSDEGMDKVSTRDGFSDIDQRRDPLGLWNLIKNEHSLRMNNVPEEEAKYIARRRFWGIKQPPEMSLVDYIDHFELAVNNMRTLNCQDIPSDAEQARHMLVTLDSHRYSEYVNSVQNDERTRGVAQPDTPRKVIEAARMYVGTNQAKRTAGFRPSTRIVYQSTLSPAQLRRPCARCGEHGHWARDCSLPDTRDTTENDDEEEDTKEPKAASEQDSKADTKTDNTPKGRKKKRGKQTKPTPSAYQVTTNTEDSDDYGHDDDYDDPYQIFGYAISVSEPEEVTNTWNKTKLCIDSFANHHFVGNEDLLTDVVDNKLTAQGVHGAGTFTKIGHLPGFGPALVAPFSKANGLALCQVENKYEVIYKQQEYISVTISDELTVNFLYDSDCGCYACDYDDELRNKLINSETAPSYYPHSMVVTVDDKTKKYSKREIQRAETARQFMRRAYYPADGTMVRTITQGTLLECPVTGRDIKIAADIFGKDVASIQGRTKDRGPVRDDRVYVPVAERKDQTVYSDIFVWRGVSFVLFVVKPLRLLLVQWIPKNDLDTLKNAVMKLCNIVEGNGFHVKEIVTDPARELSNIRGLISYNINTVGSRTHVADAEVEIRIIKERLRSSTIGTPFNVPKRIVRWQVYGCIKACNLMLRPGQEVCAKQSFTGIKPNYKKDFKAEFGEYVQAHVPPNYMERNGPKPRAVGAIALCPADNDRGSWWFMSLKKKSFFMADRWDSLPMPDVVRELLDHMYDADESKNRRTKQQQAIAMEEVTQKPASDTDINQDKEGEKMVPEDQGRDEPEERMSTQTQEQPHPDELEENPTSHADQGIIEVEDIQEQHEQDMSNNTEGQNPNLGSEVENGIKRSCRIATKRAVSEAHHIHRLSVRKALRDNEEESKKSIMKELKQLVDKEVWVTVNKDNLSKEQKRRAIRSSMFLKEKYDANGKFEKLKSRLVAGGDQQDRTIYDNLSSPTVAHESIMMILAIAASENRKLATVDITGAYLECEMPEGDDVIMKIDKTLSKMLNEVDPSSVDAQDERGQTYVKLKRALYGCVQSAKLWYDKLKSTLEDMGFKQNAYDQCVFNNTIGQDEQVTVAFHVDDLLITCVNKEKIDETTDELKRRFTNITCNDTDKHSYLAMNIEKRERMITVDMSGYIEKCTGDMKDGRKVATPATVELFESDDNDDKLNDKEAKEFHSNVAKVLYVGKKVRGDILTAVSHLASRVKDPDVGDVRKLERVYRYLRSTRDVKLVLRKGDLNFKAYVDASYGCHPDGTSRTGVVLMAAGGAVGAWSMKQKIVTKSATESEIVGISDGLTHIIWAREFLSAQGIKIGRVPVMEDNMGAINIINGKRHAGQRTRHLNVRYFFAKDRIKRSEIELKHSPTSEMVADLMTKAAVGAQFIRLNRRLHGLDGIDATELTTARNCEKGAREQLRERADDGAKGNESVNKPIDDDGNWRVQSNKRASRRASSHSSGGSDESLVKEGASTKCGRYSCLLDDASEG